jgi:hypothetical protein
VLTVRAGTQVVIGMAPHITAQVGTTPRIPVQAGIADDMSHLGARMDRMRMAKIGDGGITTMTKEHGATALVVTLRSPAMRTGELVQNRRQ